MRVMPAELRVGQVAHQSQRPMRPLREWPMPGPCWTDSSPCGDLRGELALPPPSVFEAQPYVNATLVPLPKYGRLKVLSAEHMCHWLSYRAFFRVATSCRTLQSHRYFADFNRAKRIHIGIDKTLCFQ